MPLPVQRRTPAKIIKHVSSIFFALVCVCVCTACRQLLSRRTHTKFSHRCRDITDSIEDAASHIKGLMGELPTEENTHHSPPAGKPNPRSTPRRRTSCILNPAHRYPPQSPKTTLLPYRHPNRNQSTPGWRTRGGGACRG